ncbi:hypothetical protein TSH100_17255 [Azospirillum sp. TSH100]|nr:hypothetical protein TSH100_17255 [Azospirillum sp. TSH100]
MPLHHPDDQLLIGYASGQERAGKSLLVATHLAYCPDCRQRVASYEALCGEWFGDLPCADHGALEALLDGMDSLLAAGPPPAGSDVLKQPNAGSICGRLVPEPLRGWLPEAIDTPTDDGNWREIAKGVWLSGWERTLSGTTIRLLRMASGAPVPAHRHTADELLLVLQGAFHDEYGRYAVGDVAQYVAGTDHHAFGASEEDCICLFLLDGDLIFLGEDGEPL